MDSNINIEEEIENLISLFELLEDDDIKIRKVPKSEYYKIYFKDEIYKILLHLYSSTHNSLIYILNDIKFSITETNNHIEFKRDLSLLNRFNISDNVYKSIVNKFGYISYDYNYDCKGVYYTFKNNKGTIIFDKNIEYDNTTNALGVFYKDSDKFIFDDDFMNKYNINKDILKDIIVNKIELNDGVDKIKGLLNNNYNNLKELIDNINNKNI